MSMFNDTMYQAFLNNPEQFGFTYEMWKEWYSKQVGAEFKTSFNIGKKYFTKYLHVEGEIKEGDIFEVEKGTYSKLISMINNTCKCLCIHGFKVGQEYTCHAVNLQKKFKLFLCSRDIKPEDYTKEGNVYIYHDGSEPSFKVIGEISPDVKWVKENDEFDDEEIQIVGENKYGERHPLWMYKPEDEPKIYCEIKGPCGHYH